MAANLFGNINGNSYHAPSINLFQMAGKLDKQLVRFNDTEQGVNISSVKLDISEEGLRALHGSKLSGSADPIEAMKNIEYMSEHQPIESFSNRFSQMMPSNYEKTSDGEYTFVKHSFQEKADSLLKGFAFLYDEISSGYAAGNRVRYVEDSTSVDGYRRLSKDEELSMLQSDFEAFVNQNKINSELSAKVLSDLQNVKIKIGINDFRCYEPE